MTTATRTTGPIVVEGQKADGLWYPNPPAGWDPMRFTLVGLALEVGDSIALQIQGSWLLATFEGISSVTEYVKLTIPLGYINEPLESVYVASDATFRWPGGPRE